jgi:gamma-glutamyltranspeptidase/glutathione hydrolase
VVDPVTGIAYQNRGAYFSLDPRRANVLAPRKRTLHTLLPGMLFRDGGHGQGGAQGGDPWIVVGAMGLDAQPQIHAQFVSGVVDGGLDIRTAVAAPRWFVAPPDHYETPTAVHLEARHRPGLADALAAMGHPLGPAGAFDPDLGHEHAIELVDGGPDTLDGSLAATTDPRSEGLPAAW